MISPRHASPVRLRRSSVHFPSLQRQERRRSIIFPDKAIGNYLLWIAAVIAGSIAIFDLYSSPARIARQNRINAYASSASVAVITRHCAICKEP